MTDATGPVNFIELAADIVSAYVSNNSVPAADLPSLIGEVHSALVRVVGPGIAGAGGISASPRSRSRNR